MRIVLDTNVLVAALLSPFGAPAEVLRMVLSGRLTLCHDARVIAEYRDVLARDKFGFDGEAVAELLDFLVHEGEAAAADPLPDALPDRDDEPFLEIALAVRACLVSGNLSHFPKQRCHGAKVVSPAEFVQLFRESPPLGTE